MKISQNLVLISLCTIVFSGCAAKREIVSLPESVQKEIKSTDVYIEECEKKVKADIETSNIGTYGGGGLLLALVDCAVMSHRDNCADDALTCVQNDVATFDFQEKFSKKIERKLQDTNWLHAQKINHITGINDEAHQEIFKKTNTDCVLTSKFISNLNPQLNVLRGTLYLTLYPTSEKIKKMVNATDSLETPIFKFHIAATQSLPEATKEIEENAKLWAQNNGALLKQSLENIFNQVFDNLDKILNAPNHLPGE